MSDVVATILLLALTVTLFASIFAFVGAFPQPTPQAQNEFQAAVVTATNGTYLTGVQITHLAGPVLPTSDHVLLASSRVQSAWQFNVGGSGIPVGWGLGNTSTGWALGQVWSTTFTKLVKIPDNITVYVVTSTQLLYSATIPALIPNIPPAVQDVGTVPTSLSVGEAFQVWATLSGNTTGVSLTVNLNGIPGLSGIKTMVNDSYVWVYNITAATTTAGSYDAFVTVTAASGQTVSQSVPVTISSSGGGGSSSSLSVTVGASPQPFSTTTTFGTNLYPWATITYTGSKSGTVYTNFTVVQSQGGKAATAKVVKTSFSTITEALTGPTSITAYSSSSFVTWFNTTVVIYANVSLPGVGTATGTTTFGPYNFVIGYVCFNTATSCASGTNTTGSGISDACTSSTCPYLFLTVRDYYNTSQFNGPASLTFAGYVTITCAPASGTGNCKSTTAQNETISGGTVNQQASESWNVMTNSAAGTTRWTMSSTNSGNAYYYTATMVLTVTQGSTTIGYLYDTVVLKL